MAMVGYGASLALRCDADATWMSREVAGVGNLVVRRHFGSTGK
jgi:hypothetical protein